MKSSEKALPSEEQRMQDASRAAVARAPAKLQMARAWMGIGGVMCTIGLLWILSADEPGSVAWLLLVVGGLRAIGGVFEYRLGKRMAAGEWRPPSDAALARQRKWVLAFAGCAMLFVAWMIWYGISNDLF